jgi:hypothetical protein
MAAGMIAKRLIDRILYPPSQIDNGGRTARSRPPDFVEFA